MQTSLAGLHGLLDLGRSASLQRAAGRQICLLARTAGCRAYRGCAVADRSTEPTGAYRPDGAGVAGAGGTTPGGAGDASAGRSTPGATGDAGGTTPGIGASGTVLTPVTQYSVSPKQADGKPFFCS